MQSENIIRQQCTENDVGLQLPISPNQNGQMGAAGPATCRRHHIGDSHHTLSKSKICHIKQNTLAMYGWPARHLTSSLGFAGPSRPPYMGCVTSGLTQLMGEECVCHVLCRLQMPYATGVGLEVCSDCENAMKPWSVSTSLTYVQELYKYSV